MIRAIVVGLAILGTGLVGLFAAVIAMLAVRSLSSLHHRLPSPASAMEAA